MVASIPGKMISYLPTKSVENPDDPDDDEEDELEEEDEEEDEEEEEDEDEVTVYVIMLDEIVVTVLEPPVITVEDPLDWANLNTILFYFDQNVKLP